MTLLARLPAVGSPNRAIFEPTIPMGPFSTDINFAIEETRRHEFLKIQLSFVLQHRDIARRDVTRRDAIFAAAAARRFADLD